MSGRKDSRRALLESDADSDSSDGAHLMLILSRTVVFLGWLLVSIQTVAMCLGFTGKFSYIGAGVWSGVFIVIVGVACIFLSEWGTICSSAGYTILSMINAGLGTCPLLFSVYNILHMLPSQVHLQTKIPLVLDAILLLVSTLEVLTALTAFIAGFRTLIIMERKARRQRKMKSVRFMIANSYSNENETVESSSII